MGYTITQDGDTVTTGVVSIALDTAAELSTLPTDYKPGSTVIIIATGAVYMLNTSHQWVEL